MGKGEKVHTTRRWKEELEGACLRVVQPGLVPRPRTACELNMYILDIVCGHSGAVETRMWSMWSAL